ncbi:hypothetical protein Cgig2_027671 [Carnegiea gigantea]|uniref:non-specific serine/threonine protein kinase n=1 Tax=Carnegiea gigantea TaxID=171969 RepID=A0A9Q1JR06_9CARY|nr:hypothetical protein Cgig2_027671 [Carnegiea gigantea]
MSNMRVRSQNGGANSQMGYAEMDPSGRYGRFKEILGKGAMKRVYRAFDEVLGMEVAWNQVMLNDVLRSPDGLQRLYSEVHLLKNLKHESIIRLYYSWIDIDQRTFNFITEMFTYRQKYKQIDIRAIKNWACQILRGLVYLHSRDPPVIHRDLKCDNIFVNGHLGQVKIGDLGLAAILRGSQHAHSVIGFYLVLEPLASVLLQVFIWTLETKFPVNNIMVHLTGTPEFMAPELYEEDYNELVDVYSFGMCMLEMLTSEYPYSECSNPAQIYKKVTLGKKPQAFYRIQDAEAQQFVAKCLETASKRLPAHQLLLDPFLAANEDLAPVSKPSLQIYSPKGAIVEMPFLLDGNQKDTDMTITGTVNPEDNTLFLKVQMSDKDGHVRNVHFPFNIVNDTAMDVAMEMVNELDITDWEPGEIAEMIEEEISGLVPGWKDSGSCEELRQHSFDCDEDDDENHPPYLSCSPSNDSLRGLSDSSDAVFCHDRALDLNHDWFQGHVSKTEDASSEVSYGSFASSDLERCFGNNGGYDSSPEGGPGNPDLKTERHNTTLCPQKNQISESSANWNGLVDPLKGKSSSGLRKLSRVRLFMDIRTQLPLAGP